MTAARRALRALPHLLPVACSLALACGGGESSDSANDADTLDDAGGAQVTRDGGSDAGLTPSTRDGGGSDGGGGNNDGGGASSDAGTSSDGGAASIDAATMPGGSDAGKTDASVSNPGSGSSSAAEVATKLGRDHFLIGLGNDLNNNHDQDGAYTLGVTLDVHYAYLVGLMGKGGWTDWNPGGGFVDILASTAKKHGQVPMFTLYSMAARQEADTSVLTDDSYMKPYWDGAKLLFQRLGAFGEPAIVHLEPDWWAYAQQQSQSNPSALPAHVKSLAPDCASQPDNLIGMGKCLVALSRKYAPKVQIGFHASMWADGDPAKIGDFLAKIGGAESDLVFIDMLDRDAGCYEAGDDPCSHRGGEGLYWDETNKKSPNFREHLDGVAAITKALKKPVMWWQLPLGVASSTRGGTPGHYRDNRVSYVFSHIDEFIAVGGVGAVFGVGSAKQTDITTDGGQFKRAVTKYFQSPTKLP